MVRAIPNKFPVLYIISEGPDGPIKIGISTLPGKRLAQLQTANARRLNLIWCRPSVSKDHAFACERAIHQELKEFRSFGEWFNIDEKNGITLSNLAMDEVRG